MLRIIDLAYANHVICSKSGNNSLCDWSGEAWGVALCVGQILCWWAINTGGQSYPNALKVRITDQAYTSQPEMSGASAPPNISMW